MWDQKDRDDFIAQALADTKVSSGNYHATYGGHLDATDCWCQPRGEMISDDKTIYWHNKAQQSISSKNGFADPAKSWPFKPEQVDIVGDDKLIQRNSDGVEHSEIRS